MADRKISALTGLTSPAEGDLLPVVDVSEAADANKNKSITLGTLFRRLPDGSEGAPAIGFLSDTGTSGIFRSAANEIAFSSNATFQGKFTTAGFQLSLEEPRVVHLLLLCCDISLLADNPSGLYTGNDWHDGGW